MIDIRACLWWLLISFFFVLVGRFCSGRLWAWTEPGWCFYERVAQTLLFLQIFVDFCVEASKSALETRASRSSFSVWRGKQGICSWFCSIQYLHASAVQLFFPNSWLLSYQEPSECKLWVTLSHYQTKLWLNICEIDWITVLLFSCFLRFLGGHLVLDWLHDYWWLAERLFEIWSAVCEIFCWQKLLQQGTQTS